MKWFKLIVGSLVLILLDQLSKWWIVEHIPLGEIKALIPGVISLTYLQNRGAAFSILQEQHWFFILMTLLVVGGILFYYHKQSQMIAVKQVALVLILSGALGNFIDRIRLGYVVDMIHTDFMNFAIFNVADSYLSIGVVLLMLILWKEDKWN
ncbi:signal peptidase II [Streptococcus hongkongensis]|nr:lipoprotein signal peptidase [Streptococcus uberis]